MPSVTEMVTEMALELFGNFSPADLNSDLEPEEWINGEGVKIALETEAWDHLRGEREEEEGELFPSWVTLIVTPAIQREIDWETVAEKVLEMWLVESV